LFDRAIDFPKAILGEDAVVAVPLGFQKAAVDRKANLAKLGQIVQPLADPEIPRVVDGGFGPQCALLFPSSALPHGALVWGFFCQGLNSNSPVFLFFVVCCFCCVGGSAGLRDNQRGGPASVRGAWPRYNLVFGSPLRDPP